jgi:PAS domain S-box-containing protein
LSAAAASPSDVSSGDPAGLLAAIVSSSTDAILSKDLGGRITSWNRGAEHLFGYAADEAIGRSIDLISPPDRASEEAALLERVGRGEHVEHFETVRRRKDGSLVEVSINLSPIRDHAGAIIGASSVARDIGEQRRAQERLRVTLDSIGDAVVSTDVDGTVIFMNPVAERMIGCDSAEASGRHVDQVIRITSEVTGERLTIPVQEALRSEDPVRWPSRALLGGAHGAHPVEGTVAAIRSDIGTIGGIVFVFRDISRRRQAELAANRLAAIVSGSDDAIVSKDLNGIVTSWNAGAERVFGWTEREMLGQSILKVIPPERHHEEPDILARFQRGSRVDHFETVRVRKDGTRIDVSLTISPIRDEEGRVVGASKIARDVTEVKAAQAMLERHARELEEKVRERTAMLEESIGDLEAFSYSLSHDLRAPLRAIRGFSEVLSEDYGEHLGDGTRFLDRIMAASERMERLIQDVLAFARLAHQHPPLVPVDVDRVARELIAERPELQLPRADVTVPEPLPAVVGHEATVIQCLSNLLDNAVKFVPPGTLPKVCISAEAEGDCTRICVADNGIGIEPEAQQRLFELFHRVATSGTYHGTGLGLAIVRKAAERMNGQVGVRSSPGKGSTFWLELPTA